MGWRAQPTNNKFQKNNSVNAEGINDNKLQKNNSVNAEGINDNKLQKNNSVNVDSAFTLIIIISRKTIVLMPSAFTQIIKCIYLCFQTFGLPWAGS